MSRHTPHVVVTRHSPNQGSRNGVHPVGIVIHSTESDNRTGNGDLIAVADFLCRPSVQASAHVMTDADGHSARMVADESKAWHCAAYNSQTLGIEQVGRAAQSTWTRDELRETARWVARWSKKFDIPIRRGSAHGGRITRSGVLMHSELGAEGGGHHDPGSNYPITAMLALARFYRSRL